uniref:Wsv525 n=1 Tax=White spot syndrome virus TaxID=342409 RepID=A0A8E7EZD1_9VIRU|nr:MAG: hypothetical protein KOBFAEHK_00098 [White spot syndrome virus]
MLILINSLLLILIIAIIAGYVFLLQRIFLKRPWAVENDQISINRNEEAVAENNTAIAAAAAAATTTTLEDIK